MNDEKVISLADKVGDNSFKSPMQLLQDALDDEDVKSGKYNRAIVIFLNNKDDDYDTMFQMANMRCSEAISLLVVIIKRLLGIMGY